MRRVFIGPYGVRAGWRLLIYFALLAVLFAASAPVAKKYLSRMVTDFSAPTVIVNELFSFIVIVIATMIMGRFERRRLADYGLPPSRFLGKQFWMGALWGFVMLSFIVAMMALTHAYSPGRVALSPLEILKYGLLWAVAFLMVGLFEEFSFRGYMLYTLTTGIGFWPAAILTCLLFAWAHHGNSGENWVGVSEIVLIAFFLCLALRRTGSLWFAIGWHMAFDWGESFLYSTPNSGIHATGHMLNASLMGSKWLSGGSVGPEASVFDLIVTIIGTLLLARFYPEAKYPQLPATTPALEPAAGEAISTAPTA
jgi:hypothetical protein